MEILPALGGGHQESAAFPQHSSSLPRAVSAHTHFVAGQLPLCDKIPLAELRAGVLGLH